MVAITIRNLTKRFDGVVALDRVNLSIQPGEIFFLLGPSGCGKTTLLRSVAGFYQPEDGQILFDDEDVSRTPPHKRNTGMMFQSYALWPHMTVAGNVAFGLEERKVPADETRKRVREALASVRMEEYAGRKINQLSGGQQQRVALARALVIRPRCLLLDEPLSNLDARLRLEMRGEIRRVCKESGLTAIYVTHDQKEALSISDRIAILEAGRVAQVGPPKEVYRHPATRAVANFIGETNFLPGTVRSAGGGIATVESAAGTFTGTITDPDWRPAAGDDVTLSIRPECWSLHTNPAASNCLAGRLGNPVYLGELAQYELETAGLRITIYEMNPKFVDLPQDTIVHATAKPEDVVVLKT